ncbi:T9SS type A sorting domain-containing protein [Bacteroides sp.]
MKNYLLGLMLVMSMAGAQAQTEIANFDNGANPMTCTDEGGVISSFEVIDNPETTGLNNTPKALKLVISDGGEWYGGLRMVLPEELKVNDQNRYLHIMMKFKNIGTQNFHFAVYSSTVEKWSELVNARDEWFDYVIDLYNVEETKLEGLIAIRFQGRPDNPVNKGNEVYIDEIVMNDISEPRGAVIETGGIMADFEDGSFNKLICADDGGGVASFEVTDNPDKSGINSSEKSLKLEVASTPADYWQGLRVMFQETVVINENTCYLHVMMHHSSNDQSYEYAIFADGEHYQSEKISETGWVDHVIDLNSLVGKSMTGFRYSTRIDRPNNLGKIRYLDEIVFNADPTPRNSQGTSLQEAKTSNLSVFNAGNGITIQGVDGKFTIYSVSGALIYSGIAVGNTHVNLPQGFYIVEVRDERHKIVVK